MGNERHWRIESDFHTHTVYSHGKGTIKENMEAARKKGLKILGIADHGPGHKGFGIKREDIFKMRREIDQLAKLFPDLEIKLGLEANISMTDGSLDVDDALIGSLDYLMAGYHYGTIGRPMTTSAKIHFYNYLSEFSNSFERRVRIVNTKAVLRSMEHYDLFALTHPGAKAPVYMEEIIKGAIENDVLLEINNKHGHLNVEELRMAGEYGANCLIGSDAHRPGDIGQAEDALKRVEASGVDKELIVNLALSEEGVF